MGTDISHPPPSIVLAGVEADAKDLKNSNILFSTQENLDFADFGCGRIARPSADVTLITVEDIDINIKVLADTFYWGDST